MKPITIDDAIAWYKKRRDACEAHELEGRKLVGTSPNTVKELKNILGARRGMSKMKKADLKKMVEGSYKSMIMEGESRKKHYDEQIAVLDEVKKRGIDVALNTELRRCDKELGEKGCDFRPVADYDAGRTSITDYESEKDADAIARALERQVGNTCVLYGGGGAGYDFAYVDGVEKISFTRPNSDKKMHHVSVNLFMPSDQFGSSDLAFPSDWCSKEESYTRAPSGLRDVEKTHRTIGSWRIACRP